MPRFKPGVSFSDFVLTDTARSKTHISLSLPSMGVGLPRWIFAGSILAICLLWVRVVLLAGFLGSRYAVLSDENRISQIIVPAPRGIIFDRNSKPLATNSPAGRVYPLGPAAAHVVGFLGAVEPNEVGLLRPQGGKYTLHDLIGRGGIEKVMEESLKGQDGGRVVEVDHAGAAVREMGTTPPIPGSDIKISLDADLQTVAYTATKNEKAAVVVSIPSTGEILALVSTPSFDPAAPGLTDAFLNRAIGALYAPGSTFKMITTIAGIDSGKLPRDFTYQDVGFIRVGDFVYNNWFFTQYGRTEGLVGWVRALTRSTDTFFYKAGEDTGVETLAAYANTFGFGKTTGIDIDGEVEGLVPTPEWKLATKGEKWFLGNTYHMAIGQGDVLTTPLQVNIMTNILATGGKKCKPHLLGTAISCEAVKISPEALDVVKKGMIGACSAGGTAFPLFDFASLPNGRQVACKTGTAEYIRPDGKTGTHAWLTAFAPADNPTISVTVLVEGGGEGSRAAAPVARKILAKYFGVDDHYNYAAIAGEGE